jgi:hypothetical protein
MVWTDPGSLSPASVARTAARGNRRGGTCPRCAGPAIPFPVHVPAGEPAWPIRHGHVDRAGCPFKDAKSGTDQGGRLPPLRRWRARGSRAPAEGAHGWHSDRAWASRSGRWPPPCARSCLASWSARGVVSKRQGGCLGLELACNRADRVQVEVTGRGRAAGSGVTGLDGRADGITLNVDHGDRRKMLGSLVWRLAGSLHLFDAGVEAGPGWASLSYPRGGAVTGWASFAEGELPRLPAACPRDLAAGSGKGTAG